ncbi:hypothetical protein [Pseudomonas purpurea]|uniref:hypothetical protein n=1 Tax=Pseudomonas purpurea TaxID=3136737 RepID=UPI003264A6A9
MNLYEYAQPLTLPTDAKPDALGLYQHLGKHFLPLEGSLYAVRLNRRTGQFHIEHPGRADARQPRLRHNHHGAWHTEFEQPLSWDRETVMRRLGHSVESFSSAEREQILCISGYHDDVLREMHVESLPPPSLLTDCIKRFRLDRDLHSAIAPNTRKSLFESRYRALENTHDLKVQPLLVEAQGLPTDIAQELLSNATGSEWLQLHGGRAPQRLKEAALKAMEAVRAARACEGFYRASLETADTHRLALHSLDSLPGWPADLRIEVRDFSHDGPLRDSIGPIDAPALGILIRAEDATYQVYDGNQPVRHPGDFYAALLQALPDAQYVEPNLAIDEGQTLKQRIAQHITDQPTLRRLFAKHPRRKPFYDPTTLRLPGGHQGYPRNHATVPTLDSRVREVYPSLAPDERQRIALELQRDPNGPHAALSRRACDLSRLREDLSTWLTEPPIAPPETRALLSDLEHQAAQHNRRLLAQEILRSWRRQSERDFNTPDDADRYTLDFTSPILGDLPTLNADFSHVSHLSLEGSRAMQGVPEFLQSFKGLQRLELRRFCLPRFPDAVTRMPHLDTLILSDCGIRFDASDEAKLASLNTLVMLDLSSNPFTAVPNLESLPELVHLDLSHTGLTEVPVGVIRHPKLNTAKLSGNKISELPSELFDSPVYHKHGVQLGHNPLSSSARELIKHHYFSSAYDVGVYAPEADIERVTALYPNTEPRQASDFVYDLPGTLEDGRFELERLETELAQLGDDLSAWVADLPALHPRSGEPFNAPQQRIEREYRSALKQRLEQCWRRETGQDDFNDALEPTYELIVNTLIHGDLPTLKGDFSHVSALEVHSAEGVTGIGGFLEAFPNLRSLTLRDCNLGNLPDALFTMSQLRALSLAHCRISLSSRTSAALAQMEQLDTLDLGSNPLGQAPDLSQMTTLVTVRLNDTGIREVPHGVFHLAELEWVDLSDNAFTEIPGTLLELPLERAEGFNFSGNRFSGQSLENLIAYFERTGVHFGIEELINPGDGLDQPRSEGTDDNSNGLLLRR